MSKPGNFDISVKFLDCFFVNSLWVGVFHYSHNLFEPPIIIVSLLLNNWHFLHDASCGCAASQKIFDFFCISLQWVIYYSSATKKSNFWDLTIFLVMQQKKSPFFLYFSCFLDNKSCQFSHFHSSCFWEFDQLNNQIDPTFDYLIRTDTSDGS